jgi:hypothetical protein
MQELLLSAIECTWCIYEVPGMILLRDLKGDMSLDHRLSSISRVLFILNSFHKAKQQTKFIMWK